ncbi:hypothetical protein FACS1894216_15000 [Synergistales bacterium]|nr:hypothetical protein FACS1894216_15000 [Synergistales bacterium]
MAQTNINIRVDDDVKLKSSNICDELGLTMTAAFNVFVKTVVRKRSIPFELSCDESPESIRDDKSEQVKFPSVRAAGMLRKYAKPELIPLEEGAWARAAVEKHFVRKWRQQQWLYIANRYNISAVERQGGVVHTNHAARRNFEPG